MNKEVETSRKESIEEQVKTVGSNKWLSVVLICGAFLSGLGTSHILNNNSNETAIESSVDVRADGIGEQLEDVQLGMSLEGLKESVDLDEEGIHSEEFSDEYGEGTVISVDTPLSDEEFHRDYVIVSDGEVERKYELISVKEENVDPIVSSLIDEIEAEHGKYIHSSSFYVEDADAEGYVTNYTWEMEDFAKTISVSLPKDGLVDIIKDEYLFEPFEAELDETIEVDEVENVDKVEEVENEED